MKASTWKILSGFMLHVLIMVYGAISADVHAALISPVPKTPTVYAPSSDSDGVFSVSWGDSSTMSTGIETMSFGSTNLNSTSSKSLSSTSSSIQATTTVYYLQQKINSGSYLTIYKGYSTYKSVNVSTSGTYRYRVQACIGTSCSGYGYSANVVVSVQTPPTISNITNRTINEDSNTGNIAFTIGDAETAASSLTLSKASSNTSLVPSGNIVFGGSGANRTVKVTPAANKSGSATITVTVSDGGLTKSDTFVVTVTAINDDPTIVMLKTGVATNEDTTSPDISFTVADADDDVDSLIITASSNNTVLLPTSNISITGTGTNRILKMTPKANKSGSASVTLTVSDGTGLAFDSILLTVNPVDDNPTISNITNRTINEDNNTGAILFIIGDQETSASSLILSKATSNTTLVPTGNIVFGGSGANRTVKVTPAANKSGSATITVTVSDGSLTKSDSFVVTVSAVNDSPTISNISNRTINEDSNTGNVAFTIGDQETSTSSLTLSRSSSNTTLVPTGNIALGGSGANRTVKVTPAANKSGSATITVTVSDGSLTKSDTFVVTVSAVNDSPTISNISNRTINEDSNTGNVAFTIGDQETSTSSLTLSKASSNTTLVPTGNIVFGGSGANRTVKVTPAANKSGSATITVTVSDGSLTKSDTFAVTVSAVNDAPTISNISSRTINEDSNTGNVAFTIGDQESSTSSLTLSKASSNSTLVPSGNIVFGGSGDNRTVKVTPAANKSGSATITVTVSDGNLTKSDTFVVTVTAINDDPTIVMLKTGVATNEDTAAPDIAFTVDDVDDDVDSLIITANSSNTVLLPNSNISITGTGTNRILKMTPKANKSGSANVTLIVSDENGLAFDSILLTVNSVEDFPVITQGSSTSITVIEDIVKSFTLTATDGDDDTLTWSIQSQGSKGTATASGTGTAKSISYSPISNISGSDSFVVKVSDGTNTDSITVSVSITAVNDDPVANAGTDLNTIESHSNRTLTGSGIDVDGSIVSYSWAQTSGSAVTSWTNKTSAATTFKTPNISADETLIFTLTVTDNLGGIDTDTVNVFVNDRSDVTIDTPTTNYKYGSDEPLYGHGTNVRDSSGTVVRVRTRLYNNDTSTWLGSWQDANYNSVTKEVDFTYSDTEKNALSSGVKYRFYFLPNDDGIAGGNGWYRYKYFYVNDKPVISGNPPLEIQVGENYNFTPTVSDVDDLEFTFSIQNKPSWASFNTSTGALTGIPQLSDEGTANDITITVNDGTETSELTARIVVVKEGERSIGALTMPVSDVADAAIVSNARPNTSDIVGTLPSSAKVSNGTVNYNVPIKLPPGRRGMQPQVALSYGSGGGSGVAGVGWQLSAMSTISRCGASWIEDGDTGRVNLSDDDRLCLDGSKLIVVYNQYGDQNSEYRTREDSFRKITLRGGNYDNPNSYFEVIDKSGRITYYGETANSTLVLNNSVPFKWAIERVIDNSVTQNNILYDYSNSGGEFLLTDIRYTGVGTDEGNRLVHFEYENRNDKSFQYISGGLLSNGQRLKEIISSIGSVDVSKYYLSYESTTSAVTNRTRLESITQCGFESLAEKCLPERQFNYSGQSQSFDKVESTNTIFNADFPWSIDNQLLGDYNGDGTLDYVRNHSLHIMKLENEQLVHDKVIALPFLGAPGADPYEKLKLSQLDIDGDGVLDILGLTSAGLTVATLNAAQDAFIEIPLGIPMACLVLQVSLDTFDGPKPYSQDYKSPYSCRADAFPDGAGGFYLFHQSSILTHPFGLEEMKLSRINKSCDNYVCNTQPVPLNLGADSYYGTNELPPARHQILDFDGDGDLDLVRLANDGTGVKLSVITNDESGAGVNSTSTFDYSSISFSADNKWAMGSGNHWMDANGDGLSDLLLFDETWKLYINEGGSFSNAINTGIDALIRDTTYQDFVSDHPNYTTHSSIRVVDYNGDGLDDFMFLDRDVHKRDCYGDRKQNYCREGNGHESPDWRDFNITENAFGKYSVYLSSVDGTGNVNFDLQQTEIEGTIRYFYPIDIDSDGLLDFVGAKWYHDATISDLSINLNPTKVYLYFGKTDGQNIEPDLLLKAEDDPAIDSFGTKDEFEYISYVNHKISNNANYKVDNSDLAGGDYYRIPTTQLVAVEHRSNNVLSGQNTLSYEYGDSVFHQAGLGFLGFDSVKEVDHAKGVTSEAFYRMDYPLNGRMTSSTSRETADNSILKSETLTWCDLSTNGCNGSDTGVYFVHLDQKSTEYFDVDGNPLKDEIQVYTAYDSYGNLTDSTTTLSDTTTTHTTVLSNKFLPANESSWWVNKLDESTVTKSVSYTDARSLRTNANQAKAVTRKVTWKTGDARQLATETHTSNDSALERAITYSTYDSFGNPTRVESSGTAIAGVNYTDVQNDLIKEFNYSDYDGYFANSEENGVWTTATVSRTWDIYHGQPLTETAANGTVVTYTYDGFGRIASTETNTTPTRDVVYEWCDANCTSNAIYKQSFVQDGMPTVVEELNIANQVLRRLTESFESSNNQVEESFEFDAVGRTLVENLPAFVDASTNGSVQYLNYDVLGRPGAKVTANAPQSYTASYTYSGVNTTISVDAGADGSLSMARQYNFLNQLLSTTDVDSRQAHMRYDANGSPILIEDVDGNNIHASYDSFGNKLSFDDPNNGVWNFRYNALGQLRWQQDAKLTEVRFNYDNLGRNNNRYVNDVLDSTWVYDTRVLGALTSELRNNLQKDYYYDTNGRLVTESSLITHGGSSKQFDFNYAYDGYYGRVKGLQFPTGEIEAYNFDNYGYLTQNVDPNNPGEVLRQINAISAQGKVASQQYHNGLYDIKTFQVSGDSERVCVSQSSTCSGANELAQIFYSNFDNFGNLTDKQEIVKQVSEHFQYDQFHRITRSTRAYTGLDAPTFLPSETIDYDYDALGNLLLKTDYASSYSYTGGTTGGPNAVQSVTKLDLSQVNFSYDANGNMETGDDISLTYDSFNKPINIIRNQVTSSFEYGADDQRYLQVLQNGTKTTTTYYVDKRFEEIETDDNGQVSTEKRHYLGDFSVLTHRGNTKSLKFIHGDRLGSTYLITEGYRTTATIGDVSELEVERRSFDVFGKPRDALWGDTNEGKLLSDVSTKGFTTHEHLDEVELIHMNGRAFDYNLGRFLSVDPFIQFPQNSQSINGYSYLMNNPLAGTDPSGYLADNWQPMKGFESEDDKIKRQQAGLASLEMKIAANGARQQSVGSIVGESGGDSNPQIKFVGDVNHSVTADGYFQAHVSGENGGGIVGVICGAICRAEAREVSQAHGAVTSGQEGAIIYLHVVSFATGAGDIYALGLWGVKGVSALRATYLASRGGNITMINGAKGTSNCGLCAIAFDKYLATGVVQKVMASNPMSYLKIENLYGRTFGGLTSLTRISAQMSKAGAGSRGIVFARREGVPGHFFNVRNKNGVVEFLDAQAGKVFSKEGQNFIKYQLLRTN